MINSVWNKAEFFETIIKYKNLKKGRRKYRNLSLKFAFYWKKYIIKIVFIWKFIKKNE